MRMLLRIRMRVEGGILSKSKIQRLNFLTDDLEVLCLSIFPRIMRV